MYQYEEVYERPRAYAFPLTAMGLTAADACTQAKTQLCSMGWNQCATATCADVVAKLCSDCSLFVAGSVDQDVRLALTGSLSCPISPCPATSTPPPGGGIDTTTILLFAGVAVVGSVAIYALTRQRKPQLVVARQAPARGGGA